MIQLRTKDLPGGNVYYAVCDDMLPAIVPADHVRCEGHVLRSAGELCGELGAALVWPAGLAVRVLESEPHLQGILWDFIAQCNHRTMTRKENHGTKKDHAKEGYEDGTDSLGSRDSDAGASSIESEAATPGSGGCD